jgi:CDP-diacylglycerol--glycerol-3-phosphate 3-phosphatidyltransferase
LGFANKISIARILLIPFFVGALFYCSQERFFMRWVVGSVFFIAVLTDFADGLVARAFKQKTKIGTVLDPLADKLLLLNAFIWIYHLKKMESEM